MLIIMNAQDAMKLPTSSSSLTSQSGNSPSSISRDLRFGPSLASSRRRSRSMRENSSSSHSLRAIIRFTVSSSGTSFSSCNNGNQITIKCIYSDAWLGYGLSIKSAFSSRRDQRQARTKTNGQTGEWATEIVGNNI